jgi:hypothetical protein
MDGSMHNIRIMRNMLINSASHPMSTRPSVGGPIYFIRNIVYHAPGGSTRLTAGSPGVFFYNNTILTETSGGSASNVHWRNNLMLPENAAVPIFSVNTYTNYSSSDYNGFGLKPGAPTAFQWNSPPFTIAVADTRTPAGEALTHRKYATLEDYACETKQDQHSLALGYDTFVNVPKLDANNFAARPAAAQGRRSRLPAEARIGSRRSRHAASDDYRRVLGHGARSRGARTRTARAGLRSLIPDP